MGKRDARGRFLPGTTGNPAGRPRKQAQNTEIARSDGFFSAVSGMGVVGRDPRMAVGHQTVLVDDGTARSLWASDDLAAKAIETWPDEMLREGWTVKIPDDDQGRAEDLRGLTEDLDFDGALTTAMQYERAYGGAAILLGANDGSVDLRNPLQVERVRSFDWMTVLEPREVKPVIYQTNPREKGFGDPVIWRLDPYSPGGGVTETGGEVHASRLLLFRGIRVSRMNIGYQYEGFGHSVLTRVWGVLRDFGVSWGAAAKILSNLSQVIYRLKDLTRILAQNNDKAFQARMEAIELSRSVFKAVVLDVEDEFETQSVNLANVPEMLDKFESRLAAALDMPITILMGRSPAGMNATGESDIRTFYDKVASKQRRVLKPKLDYLLRILMHATGGEPEQWQTQFNPLWQPTRKEQAEERKLNAEADRIYLDAGVVAPEEVAVSRWGGEEYSADMQIDFANREAYDEMQEQEVQAAERELEAMRQTPAGDEEERDDAACAAPTLHEVGLCPCGA